VEKLELMLLRILSFGLYIKYEKDPTGMFFPNFMEEPCPQSLWFDKEYRKCAQRADKHSPLNLGHLRQAFNVFFIGMLLSLLAFITENWVAERKERRRLFSLCSDYPHPLH